MLRLLMRKVVVVSVVLASLTSAAAPPAHAAKARGAVVIEGRGFGHGRGLGQWGARGKAERGASWRAIVAHYYRGTTLTRRAPGERIRALVATSSAITVTSARSFRMQWSGGRLIGTNDRRRRFVRVRFERGHYVVEKSRAPRGPWRRVTRGRSPVVFVRGRSPLEVVGRTGASRAYRGTIEIRRSGARLVGVNHLPLEEYLFGVVPREVPSTWPAEALRAQAVAARSYAVALKERSKGRAYDVCSTTACQVYGGLATRRAPGAPSVTVERRRTSDAVLATRRTVLAYKGKPILAEYSSSTGGTTAAGSKPYLRPVADPADRAAPHHAWRVRVDAARIERAFPAIGRLRSLTVRERDGAGAWGGRVRTIRLTGTRRTLDVWGGTFAARLGLRSRYYRIA